jgi:transglutaminase-like putative cysteine protease
MMNEKSRWKRADARRGASARAKLTFPALLLVLATVSIWAEDKLAIPVAEPAQGGTTLQLAPFWITAAPVFTIPVGGSGQYFSLGGGGSVVGEYRLPFAPFLLARAGLEYGYSNIPAAQSISLASVAAGVGASYNFIPNLGVKLYADGGATYGFFNQFTPFEGYWNPFVKGGLDVYFDLPPGLLFSVGGSFLYQVGLYMGVGISVGASIGLGEPVTVQKFESPKPAAPSGRLTPLGTGDFKGSGLEMGKFTVSDIYPVFYKYYDNHPIGTAVLHNFEGSSVENVAVSVYVKDFMDNPKETIVPGKLAPGAEAAVDLFGLFNKAILANAEVTKVSASITLRYSLGSREVKRDYVQTVRVLDRNALTWDDTAKAAAFVSAKDPTAVKFAKNVASMVSGAANTSLDRNLLMAIAIHDALTLYGLTYSSSPIPVFTTDKQVADSIQFPSQTLEYKGGKCSDFSVLYASMLEAVGIETAFITIPGHIYLAVGLAMTPEDARTFFQRPDNLVFKGDKVWLPLEITLRDGGFLKAWDMGAKEWIENTSKKTAGFVSIRDSWKTFEPVGYAASAADIKIPDQGRLSALFASEMQAFIAGEMGPRESALLSQIAKAADKTKLQNSLAVLHSRYGLVDKGEKEFQQILATVEYLPALINLGNIYFLQGKLENAAEMYDRAYKKAPANTTVILCVARVNHAQENYTLARKSFVELQTRDPQLAGKFAYLGLRGEEATRAADAAQVRGIVVWSD